MNALTHTQVSEYPWGFQPEEGYEYAEFHSACEVCRDNGIQKGHALCYLAETIPNTYEIVSSPVLLSAGWYVLARRPASNNCCDDEFNKEAHDAIEAHWEAEIDAGREFVVSRKALSCEESLSIWGY